MQITIYAITDRLYIFTLGALKLEWTISLLHSAATIATL